MGHIDSSAGNTAKYARILLHGPSGHGKTVTACTMSAKFPENPNIKEKVVLDDIYVCQFDPQGMDSLAALGLEAPYFDASADIFDEASLRKTMFTFFQTARERVLAGKTKVIILDPISSLDVVMGACLAVNFKGPQHAAEMAGMHATMMRQLQSLPCHLVITAHCKVPFKMETKNADQMATQEAQEMARGVPGEGEILPDIAGRAMKFHINNARLVLPVYCDDAGKRCLFTKTQMGFTTKCFYPGLDVREPPHLGKLFAKIRKSLGLTTT